MEDISAKVSALSQAIAIVGLDQQTPHKKPATVADDVVRIAEKLYAFYRPHDE